MFFVNLFMFGDHPMVSKECDDPKLPGNPKHSDVSGSESTSVFLKENGKNTTTTTTTANNNNSSSNTNNNMSNVFLHRETTKLRPSPGHYRAEACPGDQA